MTQSTNNENAHRLIGIYSRRLSEDLDQKVVEWKESGGERLIAENIRRRAFYRLNCALLEARALKDCGRARQSLLDVVSITLRILDLAREGVPYECDDLEAGIYAAMMLGSMDEAKALAVSILSKPRTEGPAAFYAGFSRLSASFVIDDRALFASERRWVDENQARETTYWWHTAHDVYHDLMHSVIERDLGRFNELMAKREHLFAARPKDKNFRDVDLRFGGSAEDNSLVIDYMGAAIAKVGIRRGMNVDYSSDSVPVGLLRD